MAHMDNVLAHADNVLMTDSGDMKVLMSMDTGQFVELNHTGRAIWELLDGHRTLAQVVDELQRAYAVPRDECETEVSAFADGLLAENLVKTGS